PKLRLRCPLPPGVSTFGDPITVGGAVGLHCRQCPGIGRVVVNKWIQENVDGVGERLDGVFDSAKLYVHRGLFACDPEAHFVFNSPTMKTPQEGFQRAHLLTMMVDKQYKAWHSSRFLDADHARDLQDLVGADVVPTRGTRVTWDMIYLVAVRRWKDRYGVYHYFPESTPCGGSAVCRPHNPPPFSPPPGSSRSSRPHRFVVTKPEDYASRKGPRAGPRSDAGDDGCSFYVAQLESPLELEPPAPPRICFAVPLPPNTDPEFKIGVSVRGVAGMSLGVYRTRSGHLLNTAISRDVDGADTTLDAMFPAGTPLHVHRGLFCCDLANIQPKLRSWTAKDPSTGFTLAHLLTVIVQKQHNNWVQEVRAFSLALPIRSFTYWMLARHRLQSKQGMSPLHELVGLDAAGTERGTLVAFESLFVVAIRRHKRDNGTIWYYPQIEIRIPPRR
ncbi:hypothetical protein C8Q77DRAFT_1056091, partial [Trametes polyzona]